MPAKQEQKAARHGILGKYAYGAVPAKLPFMQASGLAMKTGKRRRAVVSAIIPTV